MASLVDAPYASPPETSEQTVTRSRIKVRKQRDRKRKEKVMDLLKNILTTEQKKIVPGQPTARPQGRRKLHELKTACRSITEIACSSSAGPTPTSLVLVRKLGKTLSVRNLDDAGGPDEERPGEATAAESSNVEAAASGPQKKDEEEEVEGEDEDLIEWIQQTLTVLETADDWVSVEDGGEGDGFDDDCSWSSDESDLSGGEGGGGVGGVNRSFDRSFRELAMSPLKIKGPASRSKTRA